MCCGCHRNRIIGRIDAARATDGEDSRKALLEVRAQLARIEENALTSCLLPKDLARNDVARRQLHESMSLDHESLSLFVEKNGTLTSHCF